MTRRDPRGRAAGGPRVPGATPPRKRFGQHFLIDRDVIQRLLDAIRPGEDVPIVEIGPGRGALTLPLLASCRELHAVEIDRDLARDLALRCAGAGHLHIHRCDVLEFDLADRFPVPCKVVGNLPYNISTPCLFHLLEQLPGIREMIFMLQREVVERICARAGSRAYGRLTVMIQSRCRVEQLFPVGRGAFSPAPRVDSGVLRLLPLPPSGHGIRDPKLFGAVVRQAFSHRRKTLRNALRDLVPEALLQDLDIDAGLRPGELPVGVYINLANALVVQNNQQVNDVDKFVDKD